MKIQAIYKITNIVTNKFYVGSAIFLQSRWRQHRSDLNLNKHGNQLLQNAWNKYGEINFKFEILEHVWDKAKLIEREQIWIDKLKAMDKSVGYNLNPIAGSNLGKKFSPEVCEKISKAKTGFKQPRHAVIARALAITGKPRSQETRDKIGKGNSGKTRSKELRATISNSLKGNTIKSDYMKRKNFFIPISPPIIIE